eukprot:Protomagalhaensia_sp_Gyna_25__746@NODE_1357_length_1911_cov_32_665064_g1089_i0_p1_GENE_NODE_1357_length_1911_cov_32_665064_g1089_i0NODE_1357_length_1911_cov_32_665064_g1089_i0_p1_ORF_typecomplete_len148_score17_31_NODE_1357_length_1911_cov_32_665064_g1089_i0406849
MIAESSMPAPNLLHVLLPALRKKERDRQLLALIRGEEKDPPIKRREERAREVLLGIIRSMAVTPPTEPKLVMRRLPPDDDRNEDSHVDELSDCSTTARDSAASLDTASSSEPPSSSRPTAFAVPLFMRSPDPLSVPIPVFVTQSSLC